MYTLSLTDRRLNPSYPTIVASVSLYLLIVSPSLIVSLFVIVIGFWLFNTNIFTFYNLTSNYMYNVDVMYIKLMEFSKASRPLTF